MRIKIAATLICSIVICLAIGSCKKDRYGINRNAFYNCNKASKLDTIEIANKLVGTWRLRSWYCSECGDPGWHKPEKPVLVTFTSAKHFLVTENSVLASEGNLNFRTINFSGWQLNSANDLHYLSGDIAICKNQVLFSTSQLDGADYLFDRVD